MAATSPAPSIFDVLLPARFEPCIEDPIGTPFRIGDDLVVVPVRCGNPDTGWYACRVQVGNGHYPAGIVLAFSAQDLVDGSKFDFSTLTWGAGATAFGPAPLR